MKAVTMALFWTGLVCFGVALAALAREARLAFQEYDGLETRVGIYREAVDTETMGHALYRVEAAIERWQGVGLYGLLFLACAAAWMLTASSGAGWEARPGWIRAAVKGSIAASLGLATGLVVILLWENGWRQFAMKWQGHEGPTPFLLLADMGALAGALIGGVTGVVCSRGVRAATLTTGHS
jgi:hypothetical protein